MTSTILLADDHPIVLSGLKSVIDADDRFEVVATVSDGQGAIGAIKSLQPAIALLDLNMPVRSGLEVLAELGTGPAPTRVVVLAAAANDAQVHAIVASGARGLLFKETAPQDLMDCLHAVAEGKTWFPPEVGAIVLQYAGNIAAWRAKAATLTKREHDLLELVRGGKSNKEIAYSLQLTAGTVKVHLNNIFRKLGVTSRGELRRIAAEFPLDEGHG